MKVVAALAIMKDGKILMGKRKDNGKWTNPGGHVEEGEAPIHGAIREAREEAGLDLMQDQLYHLDTKIVETPGGKISVHGYKVNLHEGQTTIRDDPDDEVHRWHWVSLKKPLNKDIFDNLHVPMKDNVLLSNLGIDMEKKAFFTGFEKKAEKIKGGLADGRPDSNYSKEELKKGIKIEMEHTKNPALAKEITKDHLEEHPKYNTHLERMEAKLDKKGSQSHVLADSEEERVHKDTANSSNGQSHILAESEIIYE